MVRHTADAVQFGPMSGNISMGVGIKLPFMLLIDGGNAAISVEYDMVKLHKVFPGYLECCALKILLVEDIGQHSHHVEGDANKPELFAALNGDKVINLIRLTPNSDGNILRGRVNVGMQ